MPFKPVFAQFYTHSKSMGTDILFWSQQRLCLSIQDRNIAFRICQIHPSGNKHLKLHGKDYLLKKRYLSFCHSMAVYS